MRGQQSNNGRTLSRMLIFVTLAIALSGCSILQRWESTEIMGQGVAIAATPTETEEPEATTVPKETAMPAETATTPPAKDQPSPQ